MTTTAGGEKPDAASPEALLKAAVSGAGPKAAASAPGPFKRPALLRRFEAKVAGAVGCALLLGALVGFGAGTLGVPGADPAPLFAALDARLDRDRADIVRATAQIDRLGNVLASLQAGAGTFRKEAADRSATLDDRLTRIEQGLAGKVAGLSERIDQFERDQVARLAALAVQIDKRPPTPAPVATAPSKGEPTQTGSLPEAKPVGGVIEGWALRDVYGGTAIVEDRRRRLVEVGVGDTLPGAGRVEAIQRRGRDWVVVTRLGTVTAQPW